VTSCAVCTVHMVKPQNQGRWFVSGLALRSVTTVFSDLTLKSVAMVSPDLALKPVVCFLVEPQNQGGGGFFDLGSKPTTTIW
jgi:hypothetical protein